MTQSEFLIDAVIAMNKCGDLSPKERIEVAKFQLSQLLEIGVEFEEIDEIDSSGKLLNSDPYINSIITKG